MKTDKEISEYYIESAERHLIENDIYSIEKAVVHYKRAILFDPKNLELRKRLNEIFYEVCKKNKRIENDDIEKFIDNLVDLTILGREVRKNEFEFEYDVTIYKGLLKGNEIEYYNQ